MTQDMKWAALDDKRMRTVTIWQWAVNDHPRGWASMRFHPSQGHYVWGRFRSITERF